MKHGKIYLIPVPLGENVNHTIPAYVIEILHKLDYFIAERAKTARRFIKTTQPERPISVLNMVEINKFTDPADLPSFIQPALNGHDIGVISEAGCPGVADPGAAIVQLAHKNNLEVIPLVGPSSILLALMASGMNGQNFAFNGYLSPKKNELGHELKKLEAHSKRFKQTQIFMETPYRNNAILETVLKSLSNGTNFGFAVDITLPSQEIMVKKISEWKKCGFPDLHKRLAIFLLY